MARADCLICGGSGWKVIERATEDARPLESPDSSRAGSSPGEPKWAVPCDCTASDRTERILTWARIPERYHHCDFDNFDVDLYENDSGKAWNDSIGRAKLTVRRFAEEYMPPPLTGDPGEQGLLLVGPCGVGKTHLAVAALKHIVLRGHSGLFYDYRELLKEIQDSYNAETQSTEMSVLEPVLQADVLLLDDLGSGKPSDWVRETLGYILNSRYNKGRITIMTSNFLDRETADRLRGEPTDRVAFPSGETARAAEKDTLSDRVGVRIRSRLYDMCRMIEIVAPDYRRENRRFDRPTPEYRREQLRSERSTTRRSD